MILRNASLYAENDREEIETEPLIILLTYKINTQPKSHPILIMQNT